MDELSACARAILWSWLGWTAYDIRLHYLHYQAICSFCYLFIVCLSYTCNPHWLIEMWLVAQHGRQEQEFLILCTLEVGLCLSSLPEERQYIVLLYTCALSLKNQTCILLWCFFSFQSKKNHYISIIRKWWSKNHMIFWLNHAALVSILTQDHWEGSCVGFFCIFYMSLIFHITHRFKMVSLHICSKH